MSSSVERVAHRGGAHLAPQNTLAAFRNALTLPIDAVELDVHMSCDGYAVVFHDNTVNRLTDGSGNMLDLDFAYLRTLNAAARFPGGWPVVQQIPTLQEVLNLVKGRTRVYVEIKPSRRDGEIGRYPLIAETVVNELRTADMLQQALVISFDWFILGTVKSLEPALQTGALVSDDVWSPRSALDELCRQVQDFGCSWINMDYRLFSADMPETVHQQDLKLGLWTVNTLEDLRRFVAVGVDSLTTDRPDLFSQL